MKKEKINKIAKRGIFFVMLVFTITAIMQIYSDLNLKGSDTAAFLVLKDFYNFIVVPFITLVYGTFIAQAVSNNVK